ncbi:tRNA pseudouridine synthase A [Pseudarthrobacter chlorophenolicus A6]|uniref:tRNA pseudouridine synthase A n=1 Tax=Pseudarthrobacter chlorophenolicus (strain ATCC 700700 / DSM 12829 / CIP 107037 / JCM 12360 / KCTC 9906 / NCIMB 13794 / A6) TaxID=452863 RepID=B8HCX2_PSECP|nr:tRNA pseudouridine(38-40) synthase TruA [Pseudarthrobacter chlorophenolicus]ACL40618.1 tRNA pseudouridine synthase A [Pseudarthrobacter chlorophenolicus A6]SDQ78234.1 tRNA pseudouridine38-40 synthase [Pseudarthrobacter chlorophenolicus]
MNHQKPAAPVLGGGGFLRIRLDLSYDGGPFSGWAVQPGRRTVQGTLEEALELLVRRPLRVTVAGRTDAGVHARGQVVHLDLAESEWLGMARGHELDPATAMTRRLRGALNRVLGDLTGAVQVRGIAPAPDGFDARFSALWRRYSYRIADGPALWDPLERAFTLWHKNPLDVELLNQGAARLLGLQNFLSFCKPREGATTIRELQRFEFARAEDGAIVATVQADAFCHNMVRALIGSALYVGEGTVEPGWLYERLLAQKRDAKSVLAAPHPLVFEEVAYPSDTELLARAELTRARREH